MRTLMFLIIAALIVWVLLLIPERHQHGLLGAPTEVQMASRYPSFSHAPEAAPHGSWSGDVLAVARVCVNEAGFNLETNDCAAIFHVIKYHADRRGISLSDMARRYSSSVFNLDRPHRTWVPNLRGDLRRPRGWNPSWDWDGHGKKRWMDRLSEVESLSAGQLENPCPYEVFHWGSPGHPVDAARIKRGVDRGFWHPVDCGPTLNVFLAPGREKREERVL